MSKECVDCRFKGKGLCKNCVYGPSEFTNADRLRAMSDEELAQAIYGMQKSMCVRFAELLGFPKEELFFGKDAPDILEWLKQPAEEE